MLDLGALEKLADTPEEVFLKLRALSVDDLGRLLLQVPDKYPKLQSLLPRMPPDEVQVAWTGNSGEALLAQSCKFVSSVENAYHQFTGRPLTEVNILDYGCGWGRLTRLMYKYTSRDKIYGCDPWEDSIQHCRNSRLDVNLALCDYVPQGIPFSNVKFDLIYAFSVFTHLSERTAKAVLDALRAAIAPAGLLVITVRPIEYWDIHNQGQAAANVAELRKQHRNRGFAFSPHNVPPINGDITYGDTSMSMQYINSSYGDWELVGEDRNYIDAYQIICYLKPRQ